MTEHQRYQPEINKGFSKVDSIVISASGPVSLAVARIDNELGLVYAATSLLYAGIRMVRIWNQKTKISDSK